VRLGIVHNLNTEALVKRSAAGHLCISCAIDVALETLDVGVAKMFVTKLVKEDNIEALKTGAKTWDELAVSVSASLVIMISDVFFWISYQCYVYASAHPINVFGRFIPLRMGMCILHACPGRDIL